MLCIRRSVLPTVFFAGLADGEDVECSEQLGAEELVLQHGLRLRWAPMYPLLGRRTGPGPDAAGLTTRTGDESYGDDAGPPTNR